MKNKNEGHVILIPIAIGRRSPPYEMLRVDNGLWLKGLSHRLKPVGEARTVALARKKKERHKRDACAIQVELVSG